MTWKSLHLSALLALVFVLTEPAGQAQQTHAATTPKKHAVHPPSGNAVTPPVNAVTNQGAPLVTGSAVKLPYAPFTITEQASSSSPQFGPAGSEKKGTANGGSSAGSSAFNDLVGVSQSKDGNVSNMRVGSDQPPQVVTKGHQAGGSSVNPQAATLPGNAVQAAPTNPPKREKQAAPPHQP
jgi:hypothetical protein